MKREFDSPRFHGRLLGYLFYLARKYGITFAKQEDLTIMNLITKVLEKADKGECSIITGLMEIWDKKRKLEESAGITYTANGEAPIHEKGMKDVNSIMRMYGNFNMLFEERDFYGEEEKLINEEKKKNKKITIGIFSTIIAIVTLIIIYNLPYFKEMRYYNEVVERNSVYACQDYYSEYPNGRHYEEVMLLEANLTDKPIVVVTKYLNRFPDGKYSTEFNIKCDSLWDKEIEKYNSRDKSNESPEATRYMTAMLNYMKKERVNSVYLHITPNIQLKDYNDFSDNAKAYLEIINSLSSNSKSLTIKDNILSLTGNFNEGDKESLYMILANGVKKSFERMFSSDFVSVMTDKHLTVQKSPVLKFNYVIKNQIFDIINNEEVPAIWNYSKNGVLEKYILGIDVAFDAKFSIPNSDIEYYYSEIGEPGNEIRGIRNIEDGYRQMTQMCFAHFANKMSEHLGLEKEYFNEH